MNESNQTAAVLIDGANDITAFASKDATRYVIGGVYMNGKGTEATNGALAIRVPFKEMAADEFPEIKSATNEREQMIVPSKVLSEAIKQADKIKSNLPVLNCVRVSSFKRGENQYAQLATTDLDTNRVLESKTIDGNYPNLDQVWPDEGKQTLKIALNSSLLKTLADYAMRNGHKVTSENWPEPVIVFGFENDLSAVTFTITLEDGRKARGVLMPSRIS